MNRYLKRYIKGLHMTAIGKNCKFSSAMMYPIKASKDGEFRGNGYMTYDSRTAQLHFDMFDDDGVELTQDLYHIEIDYDNGKLIIQPSLRM